MRTRIHYSQGSHTSEQFVALRVLEAKRFKPGTEIQMEFEGANPWEGYAMARKAAMVYAGLLLPDQKAETEMFVGEIGPYEGNVLGSQSADGKQGWRIDCTKEHPREFHINWWDRRKGTKDRSTHLYGANYVTAGGIQLFWEVSSHFPGQVKRKRR
jgi:hypothetical protein